MKKTDNKKEIRENLRWFGKFSLEKRLELAFQQIKAIKILRSLKPQRHAAANRTP